jgi:hypothetical protein
LAAADREMAGARGWDGQSRMGNAAGGVGTAGGRSANGTKKRLAAENPDIYIVTELKRP